MVLVYLDPFIWVLNLCVGAATVVARPAPAPAPPPAAAPALAHIIAHTSAPKVFFFFFTHSRKKGWHEQMQSGESVGRRGAVSGVGMGRISFFGLDTLERQRLPSVGQAGPGALALTKAAQSSERLQSK